MFLAGTLMLLTVAQAAPPPSGPIESTYDEAACALSDKDAGTGVPALAADGGKCTEPQAPAAPAVPAVIDCNDPDASVWVGDMIGSCDMPSPTPQPTLAVRAHDDGSSRSCSGIFCGDDAPPLSAAPTLASDGQPFVVSQLRIGHIVCASPIALRLERTPEELAPPRLERPPRAA